MTPILILHGPNLNLLGKREAEHYGHETLTTINAMLAAEAETLGLTINAFQSNAEHVLIEKIHHTESEFIIINPAAFGHTSIALRDALLAVNKPFIEVHLSNIYRRESFRHYSYLSDIAVGTITGLGVQSYLLALRYAFFYLTQKLSVKGASDFYGYANN